MSAFAGEALWGVNFQNVISTSTGGLQVACRIAPSSRTISCASNGFDYVGPSATINDDGTFLTHTQASTGAGDDLAGRIDANGHVTLTKFRHFECFQTSWLWCDGREATRMPADAQPYQLCHTKGQTFPNGDWVAGYYLACSACTGNCEGGR